jgi:hypothetical protein
VGPEHILARLKALRDPRMRVLALVEALCEDDPTAWVHALASIMARAHLSDDPDAAEALEAITHAAADPALGYAVRQRLYEPRPASSYRRSRGCSWWPRRRRWTPGSSRGPWRRSGRSSRQAGR